MPAKKSPKNKKTTGKPATGVPHVEVLPAEPSQPIDRYENALTRVNSVLSVRGGNPQGTFSEQRSVHYSIWQSLLKEDRTARQQILELKAKENQVLNLIRDKVADNLIQTIDAAVEEGVLQAPEEV